MWFVRDFFPPTNAFESFRKQIRQKDEIWYVDFESWFKPNVFQIGPWMWLHIGGCEFLGFCLEDVDFLKHFWDFFWKCLNSSFFLAIKMWYSPVQSVHFSTLRTSWKRGNLPTKKWRESTSLGWILNSPWNHPDLGPDLLSFVVWYPIWWFECFNKQSSPRKRCSFFRRLERGGEGDIFSGLKCQGNSNTWHTGRLTWNLQ